MEKQTRPNTDDAKAKTKRPRAPRHPQDVSVAAVPDALITVALTCHLTGLGRGSLYRKTKEGIFPKPVKLGARCTRWRAGDVMDWLKAQAQASQQLWPVA